LIETFDLQAVILTRGKDGTAALTPSGWVEGQAAAYDRQDGADTVGAGDACTAGLLSSLVLGRTLEQALDLANQMGAFVAHRSGATPELPDQLLEWLT
jgi:fructokinase